MSDQPVIAPLRNGDVSKADPFTICIAANPALEAPWESGAFVVDPIMRDRPGFDRTARYIVDALFGNLPGQAERLLADPTIERFIRVVTLWAPGLPPIDANALIAQDGASSLLVARRVVFSRFLTRFGLAVDVAYAVSESGTHTRASAWFTSDDDSRPGLSFTLDGVMMSHRYYNLIPGTVAIHTTASSLTALHEFEHAISSYTNGKIVDLYVDSAPGLNNRHGRPIPARFADYSGTSVNADPSRDSLGYPSSWRSYHCELIATGSPAVMDDYWKAAVPDQCENDRITRQFVIDRIRAKVSR